jgi:hypothetical protein
MWLGGKTFPETGDHGLRWSDQWATPSSVRISTKISLTGKMIVYAQGQTGGRPITLEGWLTQAEFQDMQTLYNNPGQDYLLVFDSGQRFQNVVILSIESKAVLNKKDPVFINLIIKMMTVTA